MPVAARTAALAALLVGLAGCFVQDPSTTPMCFTSTDCDPGEICGDDRICYGNPPAVPFMVQLDPPASRPDLAPTDSDFFMPDNADFVARFATPIRVSGRVVLTANPTTTVAAHIVLRRPSRIKGAPDYVVTTESIPGVTDARAPSFAAYILPSEPTESYSVTIYPADDGDIDAGGQSVAERAPTYRQLGFSFDSETSTIVFPLGGESPAGSRKTITGRVVDAIGKPVGGLEVRAYGKFGPLDAMELASSRGHTVRAVGEEGEPGTFEITVPSNWEDEFEVRITPPSVLLDGEAPTPSIVLRHVHVDDAPENAPGTNVVAALGNLALPSYPAPVDILVPVQGEAPEGGLEPVVGARVRLRTVLYEDEGRVIAYEAEGATDGDGRARVPLIVGSGGTNRGYRYDVVPVPNTPHQALFDGSLEIGAVLAEQQISGVTLAARALLSGTLYDFTGLPVSGVTVTVAPSVRFTYDLLAEEGFAVSTLQMPSTMTDPDGRYSVWLDPGLLGVDAGYVFDFEPPAGSLEPRWTSEAIDVDVDGFVNDGMDLGAIFLPDPAYVRGELATALDAPVDPDDAVPFAQIRLYQVLDSEALCEQYAPEVECQVPALLRAQATADELGRLRLVLPRL